MVDLAKYLASPEYDDLNHVLNFILLPVLLLDSPNSRTSAPRIVPKDIFNPPLAHIENAKVTRIIHARFESGTTFFSLRILREERSQSNENIV